MSDEAMNEPTAEQEPDAALAEATTEQPEKALDPEDFDLAEWLNGLGPEVARYPLPGGGYIPLRARTEDWQAEWNESAKDMPKDDRDRAFLLAHVADDTITDDLLAKLQQHRPRDFMLASGLAVIVDRESSSLIDPAFLPAASD